MGNQYRFGCMCRCPRQHSARNRQHPFKAPYPKTRSSRLWHCPQGRLAV